MMLKLRVRLIKPGSFQVSSISISNPHGLSEENDCCVKICDNDDDV